MAAAATSDIGKQLSSITTCSVCCDTFTDPRQLPCIHTFCLNCIRGFTRDNQPEDEVPCPLCRKEFTIPKSGVCGLPSNFFIEQLKDILDPSSTHCEVCTSGTAAVDMNKLATMLCVDCNERQCEACAANHSRMKISRDHKLIRMNGKELEDATKMVKLFCKSHNYKPLELYCFDCKAAICMMCFATTCAHKSHKCSDVNEVADEYRKQLTSDIRKMDGTITRCCDMIEEEKRKKDEFCRKADAMQEDICKGVEERICRINDENKHLLFEL